MLQTPKAQKIENRRQIKCTISFLSAASVGTGRQSSHTSPALWSDEFVRTDTL